jgi:hypothetical protein
MSLGISKIPKNIELFFILILKMARLFAFGFGILLSDMTVYHRPMSSSDSTSKHGCKFCSKTYTHESAKYRHQKVCEFNPINEQPSVRSKSPSKYTSKPQKPKSQTEISDKLQTSRTETQSIESTLDTFHMRP